MIPASKAPESQSAIAHIERQGMHTLIANAAGVVLSLGSNILIARVLGPSGKGTLDLVNATALLFSLVLGGSLAAGLTKIVAQYRRRATTLNKALTVWLALALALTAGTLGLLPATAVRLGLLPLPLDHFWTLYISIAVGLSLASGFLRGELVGFHALVIVNRIELFLKAAYLLLFAALLLLSIAGVKTFAVAVLFANTGMFIALWFVLRGRPQEADASWSQLLHSSLPLHGANVLFFITHRADVFFIQAQRGAHEVGIYSLAVTLTQIVLLASSAFAQPLLPRVSAEPDAHAAGQAAARIARIFLVGAISGTVALAVVMSWAVPLVFGPAFAESVKPMLILLPGVIAFGLTNILISYFFGQGHSRFNLGLSVVGLLITIAGNLILTPRLGAVGAAITSTVAYGICGIVAVSGLAHFGRLRWSEILIPRTAEIREFLHSLRTFRI